jgi:hypothetical protein
MEKNHVGNRLDNKIAYGYNPVIAKQPETKKKRES